MSNPFALRRMSKQGREPKAEPRTAEPEHTPGPWKIRSIRGHEGASKTVYVFSESGTVATVWSGTKYDLSRTKTEMDKAKDANARLIAASPKLLAIVKHLAKFTHAGAQQINFGSLFNSDEITLKEAINETLEFIE